MWDIGKASRRRKGVHCRFARATGGGFPRFSGGVPRASRCSAPPRHALLTENLGKSSLWVITKDHWYHLTAARGDVAAAPALHSGHLAARAESKSGVDELEVVHPKEAEDAAQKCRHG